MGSLDLDVLTWNLQGEIGISDHRLERQRSFLDTHCSDVDCFLLQAVNAEEGSPGDWAGHLGAMIEYFEDRGFNVIHTGDWAQELASSSVQPHAGIEATHNRCNLTATRWPIDRRPLSLRERGEGHPRELTVYTSNFPEKLLVGGLEVPSASSSGDLIELWNVGIVNGASWGEEKLNMLETVYGRLTLRTNVSQTPVVVGGDFNAPKRVTSSGAIVPHGRDKPQYLDYPFYGDPHYLREAEDDINEYRFDQRWKLAEARVFDPAIGQWELRDVYWAATESAKKASTDDHTHVVHGATPPEKRLDHILVSTRFEVDRCAVWNGKGPTPDGFTASDHAPVYTELRIDGVKA